MSTPVHLPRRARGRKLQAFSDPVHDHLMSMIVSLTAELSVARERQDTLERLLERHGIVQRAEIEAYRADEKVEAERTALRDDLIAQVFHILHEQAEVAADKAQRVETKATRRGAADE